MQIDSSIRRFRILGVWEGISLLLLLGVAMPLKYVWDYPLAVRVVGSLHGLLFTVFVVLLAYLHFKKGWTFRRSTKCLVASIVPFGFLFIDQELKRAAGES